MLCDAAAGEQALVSVLLTSLAAKRKEPRDAESSSKRG